MDIEEIQKKRLSLEFAIVEAISEFERGTTLCVTRIDLEHLSKDGLVRFDAPDTGSVSTENKRTRAVRVSVDLNQALALPKTKDSVQVTGSLVVKHEGEPR